MNTDRERLVQSEEPRMKNPTRRRGVLGAIVGLAAAFVASLLFFRVLIPAYGFLAPLVAMPLAQVIILRAWWPIRRDALALVQPEAATRATVGTILYLFNGGAVILVLVRLLPFEVLFLVIFFGLPALVMHIIAVLLIFRLPPVQTPWLLGVLLTIPIVLFVGLVLTAAPEDADHVSEMGFFLSNVTQMIFLGPILGSGVALGFARNWLEPTARSQPGGRPSPGG